MTNGDNRNGDPVNALEQELAALDEMLVQVDGKELKPSQCYRFETDPVHMMFNTNCPDELKNKVQAILSRHIPGYESSSPE